MSHPPYWGFDSSVSHCRADGSRLSTTPLVSQSLESNQVSAGNNKTRMRLKPAVYLADADAYIILLSWNLSGAAREDNGFARLCDAVERERLNVSAPPGWDLRFATVVELRLECWWRKGEKTQGRPGATNFWGEEKRTGLKVGH
jgi:hypothetical protein